MTATTKPKLAVDKASSSNIDMENPEFRSLLRLIEETDSSVFLTGKAGTGKSTFLKYIISHTAKKSVVLAPTGIAAINVGGQTLHSFFRIPLQPVLPDDPEFAPARLRDRLKLNGRCIKLYKEVELIVIDEISMVRADIIDLVDRILRTFGGDRRKPFGGKQLLLVGDIFQLEPVVTNEDKAILQRQYPHSYFFNAKVFADFGLSSIELQKVYRQKDSGFVEMLDRFRLGIPNHDDIDAINSRATSSTINENTDKMVMTLGGRRDGVKRINDMHLEALTTPAIEYTGELTGDFPASSYPTDLNLTLKKGAQVIFLRNDMERRYVNGTLGIVKEASDTQLTVRLENGNEIDVEPVIWENVTYEYDTKTKTVSTRVKGTFTQFPLRTAWALTVHKSQGLTFDNINIDFGKGGAFAGGQVYVALSRCTSLDGIQMLTRIDARDVFVNPEVLRFSRTFNDTRDQEEALRRASAERMLSKADKAFRAGRFAEAVECFNTAINDNPRANTPALRRLVAMRIASIRHNDKKKKKK